jgi:hypothetical protein
MAARKLVFRRVPENPRSSPIGRGRHPLLGAMKGLVQIMPGTDLTEPADPEWGRD